MAEERNLGLARAPENSTDAEVTKEELQRRMDEARESITQTVTEIKETVVNQYQQVRESISDTLDWREQYRRHTIPFTAGALGAGLLLGYSVGGAVFGGDDDYEDDDADYETADSASDYAPRSYAAQAVVGAPSAAHTPRPASQSAPEASYSESPPVYAPSASLASTGGAASEPSEPEGPGLLERFKGTKAYDRLQQEIATMGDRVVEELSKTARSVVLPALLSKVKDLIGIDLGTQKEVAQRTQLEQQAARASAGTASAESASAAASAGSSAGGTGTTPGSPTTGTPVL
jgi:hypothetical protein